MKETKLVFIDWNGTISGSKFWWHLEEKTHPKNHIFEKAEKEMFNNSKHLLKPWMRGEMTSEDILRLISENTELNFEELTEEFIYSCKTMQLCSEDLFKYTEKLREKGLKVAIATDNMDSFTRWTVPLQILES